MRALKRFLCLVVVLIAGELFSAEQAAVKTEEVKIVFSDDFSEWNNETASAPDFDSTGMFPAKWIPYNREGEKGYIRKNIDGGDNQANPSVFLDGRIITAELIKGLDREKIIKISFRAKGENGNVILSLHEIKVGGEPSAHFDFIDKHPCLAKVKTGVEITVAVAEALKVNTGGEWKEHFMEMKMLPYGATAGRLEIKADGVLLDDIKISVFSEEKDDWQQPVFTIPLLNKKAEIDGTINENEWGGAIYLSNPFKNITTGMTVSRGTSLRMFSDGEYIYIALSAGAYGRKMQANVLNRDLAVFTDESVELYFNPYPGELKPRAVYYIAANSEDIVLDLAQRVSIGQHETGWDCKGLSVKSKKTEGFWNLEIAVPVASVELKTGNPFFMNISRNISVRFKNEGYRDNALQI